MLTLLLNGDYATFILLLAGIIFSLSIHEFGHAWMAKLQGDTTAQLAGRLSVNPVAHIDPWGLIMVILVGIGYAKPVPVNPANFRSAYGNLLVAAAGPGMNLLMALIAVNVFHHTAGATSPLLGQVLLNLALINMLLAVFNLLPIGPLDGHYILPYLLPRSLAARYVVLNDRYGTMLLLGLIVAAILWLPLFDILLGFSQTLLAGLVVTL